MTRYTAPLADALRRHRLAELKRRGGTVDWRAIDDGFRRLTSADRLPLVGTASGSAPALR